MRINIICIGNIKEKFYRDAFAEYEKRMSKFASLNVIELKEEKLREEGNEKEETRVKKVETEKIIKTLEKCNDSYNVLMDISGKQLTSEELSEFINDKLNNTVAVVKELNFIVGGSLGVDNELRKFVDYRISFSKLTFPHQLMRVILAEQIYRAFKIMGNESYHK